MKVDLPFSEGLAIGLAVDLAMYTCFAHHVRIASWRVKDCTFKLAGQRSRSYVCSGLRFDGVFFLVDATLAKLLQITRSAASVQSLKDLPAAPNIE
jgi:hypothetical protein